MHSHFSPAKAIVLFLFTVLPILGFSQSDYEKGWDALDEGKPDAALNHFEAASTSGTKLAEAQLVLSMMYPIYGRIEDGQGAFRSFYDHADNPFPAVYALWKNESVLGPVEKHEKPYLSLLEDLLAHPNIQEKQYGALLYRLYIHHSLSYDTDKAAKTLARMNYIRKWRFLGPFDNVMNSGFDKDFGVIDHPESTATFTSKYGAQVSWFRPITYPDNGYFPMNYNFLSSSSLSYAQTFVQSPQAQKVIVKFSYSGSLKLWINDVEVYANPDHLSAEMDYLQYEVSLNQGYNRILIQLGDYQEPYANFTLRLTDLQHRDLNLEVETNPQAYEKGKLESRRLPHFALQHFQEEADQDDPLTQLLLAKCYMRSEELDEAKEVLIPLMEAHPKNFLLLRMGIQFYRMADDGANQGKYYSQFEELYPESREILMNDIQEAVDEEDKAKFLELRQKLKDNYPLEEEMDIAFQMNEASLEGDSRTIIRLIEEYYRKYPENLEAVSAKYILEKEHLSNPGRALSVLERYLKDNYEYKLIQELASFHLENGNPAKAIQVLEKSHEHLPEGNEVYDYLINIYVRMNKYKKAIELAEEILLNKPSDYLTMEQLGELYQAIGNKSKASDYYEESLRYFPFSYDVNAKIRTLKDQKPVFELVPEVDPMEMIEKFEAEFKPAYKESYDIVLEKKSLIVFESMATAGTHEFMIHMNDESAIEYWQNLNFGPEPYRTLYFDELLTIKKSGEKINAERSGGEVVFTSLEVGDYIYIAYHEEQKRGGKSAAFVSDVFSINSFAPLYQSEYHLLVEGDTEFESYFSQEELEPELKEEAGFRHYTWSLTNPPVIKEETNALPSKDLTNNLHISLTPAWGDIVQWYSDLSGYQSVPDYTIQTLVEELFDGRSLSEEEKAREIYEFITKNIQYSSVDFRQSNFVPQKASRVYQSRLGDCKDVSTLYVSMAKEAGLDANLVLINTSDNGQKAVVLPSLNFNHCIVNVELEGNKTYLELTDSNLPFGYLSPFHKGAAILEIPNTGDLAKKTLTRLDFNPGYQDRVKRSTEVMIQANNHMAIQRQTLKTGIRASSFVDSYYNLDKELQDQKLTQSIKDDFSSAVSLKSFEITELEPRHDTARYTYDFVVEGDVVSMGAFRSFKLPFSDILIHMAVFEDRDRINDFNFVAYENTNVYEEDMLIQLPAGKAFMEVPENVSAEWEDFSYELAFEQVDDQTVKVQRHFKVLRENITPDDFPAFRAFMTKVNEAENTHLLFR